NADFFVFLSRQQGDELDQERGDRARPASQADPSEIIATTQTREVRINATFFEGNRRALREIGVDWSTLTNNVPGNILEFVGEDGDEEIPSTQFDGRFVQVNARGAQNVSQNVFNSLINFGNIGAGIEVQALFSAFEADNIGEVLATPSIKVMDGVEGRIQVGEDFSIKQRDFAGNITDEFFSTGTILTVTPQIINDRDTTFIYMELDVERSTAQPDPVSTIISKEEASTHTLLLNGESTVIAGLYRTDRSEVRRGIPVLKDLPPWFFGLRYLFGYNSTDISQSELIVIVQAELEKSIPERMNEQLLSKREQLENQKIYHRRNMDYTSLEEPEPDVRETDFEGVDIGEEDAPEDGDRERPAVQDHKPDEDPIQDLEEPEENREEKSQEIDPEQIEEIDRVDVDESPQAQMKNQDDNNSDLLFYTIGGTFQDKNRAVELFRRFQDNGYAAHMLYNPRTDYYFVAYKGFEEFEEASRFTRKIQRGIQPDAWLSRIITETRLDLNADQ
ncbi:MAG: type II and III secretion system protein, partial [Balneolaceae bacterium]